MNNKIFFLSATLFLSALVVHSQTKEQKFVTGKPILGKAITFNTTEPIKISIAWTPNSDASGNMYGFLKSGNFGAFKLYKINAAGNAFLYFKSIDNNIGISSNNLGLKYSFDSKGNFYWLMDNCIMTLTTAGNIETAAGEWKVNYDLKDGKNGTLAGHVYDFKCDKNDNVIFTESVSPTFHFTFNGKTLDSGDPNNPYILVRKLLTNGELTTCRYSNGDLFLESPTDFNLAANADIFYTKYQNDGSRGLTLYRWNYKNAPIKLLSFHGNLFSGSNGEKGRWTLGDTAKARVSDPTHIFENSKKEIIIYELSMHRFVKLVGNKVMAYSGTSNDGQVISGLTMSASVKADVDGKAATAQYTDVRYPTMDANDNIIFRSKAGVRKILPDGSVSTILKYTIKDKSEE
jgi:hypothetical protein